MTIKVEKRLFAAAVKALKLDVPIHSAWMEGKTVCISIRSGVRRWKPPVKKRAPAKKAPATPGAAKKKTGVKK